MTRYHSPRKTPVLDWFATLLAEEVPPAEAADRMGYPRKYGKDLMKRLRRHLGWQAC